MTNIDKYEISPKHIFTRYLDDVGDGTGNINFSDNYFINPKDVLLIPEAGQKIHVKALVITIYGDTNKFNDGSTFPGLSSALINGMNPLIMRDFEVLQQFYSQKKPKTYSELIETKTGRINTKFSGNGKTCTSFFIRNIDFSPLFNLFGNSKDKFILRLNDDFSEITDFSFYATGYIFGN